MKYVNNAAVTCSVESNRRLLITMTISDNYADVLEQVKTIVTEFPEVEWLEVSQEYKITNLFSQTVLQGGNFTSSSPFWKNGTNSIFFSFILFFLRFSLYSSKSLFLISNFFNLDNYGYMPYYEAGLHGEEQIVGVGDTGLDYRSCYFFDESNPVLFDNYLSVTNHRKIVGYITGSDNGDLVNGHGTHVVSYNNK